MEFWHIQATTWIDENTRLREISQTQRDKCSMIHLHGIPRIVHFIEGESRMEAAGAEGEGTMEVII